MLFRKPMAFVIPGTPGGSFEAPPCVEAPQMMNAPTLPPEQHTSHPRRFYSNPIHLDVLPGRQIPSALRPSQTQHRERSHHRQVRCRSHRARWAGSLACTATCPSALPKMNAFYCQLFLCLSQACLGKYSEFSLQWRKNRRFSHRDPSSGRAAPHDRRLSRSNGCPPSGSTARRPARHCPTGQLPR